MDLGREPHGDESLSQNDLDALFGDLSLESREPRTIRLEGDMENLPGSESLSQDQIDELLKMLQDE
jgi:Tfp pilus assembly pilus retraction ATPase PilT